MGFVIESQRYPNNSRDFRVLSSRLVMWHKEAFWLVLTGIPLMTSPAELFLEHSDDGRMSGKTNKTVFTKDEPDPVPQLPGEALPSIAPLIFNLPGIVKLLRSMYKRHLAQIIFLVRSCMNLLQRLVVLCAISTSHWPQVSFPVTAQRQMLAQSSKKVTAICWLTTGPFPLLVLHVSYLNMPSAAVLCDMLNSITY